MPSCPTGWLIFPFRYAFCFSLNLDILDLSPPWGHPYTHTPAQGPGYLSAGFPQLDWCRCPGNACRENPPHHVANHICHPLDPLSHPRSRHIWSQGKKPAPREAGPGLVSSRILCQGWPDLQAHVQTRVWHPLALPCQGHSTNSGSRHYLYFSIRPSAGSSEAQARSR